MQLPEGCGAVRAFSVGSLYTAACAAVGGPRLLVFGDGRVRTPHFDFEGIILHVPNKVLRDGVDIDVANVVELWIGRSLLTCIALDGINIIKELVLGNAELSCF